VSVIGVDPGVHGALAHYDQHTGWLEVTDMPIWYMEISKGRKRARVDANNLLDYFELAKVSGCQLVMIEAVGGRPKQSASGAFVFGYTVGLVYMACIACKLPIETVPSQVWKRIMNVPGKKGKSKDAPVYDNLEDAIAVAKLEKKISNGAIISRADELMPDYSALWRGDRGGYKLDRAEAALLAYYAGRYALAATKVVNIRDPEWTGIYRNADTGA